MDGKALKVLLERTRAVVGTALFLLGLMSWVWLSWRPAPNDVQRVECQDEISAGAADGRRVVRETKGESHEAGL